MNKDLAAAWDKAFERPGELVPVGRAVVCDVCGEDWTERKESGGFLFESYAYCPNCAPKGLEEIKKYGKERFIKAHCPENESYADFVRRLRGPNAGIKVTQWR